jgi:hypothetical protein
MSILGIDAAKATTKTNDATSGSPAFAMLQAHPIPQMFAGLGRADTL